MLARGRTRVKASWFGSLVRCARWLAVAGWMGAIFYLSHQSAPLGETPSATESSIAHLALYAGLAALFVWALSAANGRPQAPLWARAAVAFALTVLYGVSDELHQAFVPGRTAAEADIGLDAAGAALGLAGALLAARVYRASSPGR